jgi:hypothetical protein
MNPKTQALIALAILHAPKAAMRSSADLCIADALKLEAKGEQGLARIRALKALAYAVGIFSPVYVEASQ